MTPQNKDHINAKISEALSASLKSSLSFSAGEKSKEFPKGKETYCPRCYFEDDVTVLREDCKHNQEVKLAPEGTPLAAFQKERTDAILEMFDNKYDNGIYPTSKFFARIDKAASKMATAEKEKRESEIKSALETIDWGFLDTENSSTESKFFQAIGMAAKCKEHITGNSGKCINCNNK